MFCVILIKSFTITQNQPRKIKINLRNQKSAFIPLFVAYLGLWGYYLFMYFMTVSYSNNLTKFIQEFNSTSTIENFLGFSSNNLKQLLIDNTIQVRNIDSATQVMLNLNEMYTINSLIQQEHSRNVNDHDSQYNNAYVSVWMADCCTILTNDKLVSQEDCEKFLNGSVRQGLTVTITRYIENYRKIKSQYDKIILAYKGKEQRDKINELINSQDMAELVTTQDIYIKNLFSLRVTILIISLAGLVVIYLFLWVPILSNLSKNIEKVRSMILMIPLDICEGVKSIRVLLSTYMNNNYEDKVN